MNDVDKNLLHELVLRLKIYKKNDDQVRTFALALAKKLEVDFNALLQRLCEISGRELPDIIYADEFTRQIVRIVKKNSGRRLRPEVGRGGNWMQIKLGKTDIQVVNDKCRIGEVSFATPASAAQYICKLIAKSQAA